MAKRLASRLSILAASAMVMAGAVSIGTAAVEPGTASAATCAAGQVAGTACTITGTLNITAGALTMNPPTSLTWNGSVTGATQSVVDTVDTSIGVSDLSGALAGWHITAAATTFTNGTNTLSNTGTLVNTGSTTSVTSTTKPTATCTAVCVLPTYPSGFSDPVGLTTATSAPTPSTIYDVNALTGVGAMTLSPDGWWLNLPVNVASGSYTSTVTLQLISGP